MKPLQFSIYTLFVLGLLTGCMLPGTGQGAKEPIDNEMDGMGRELSEYFPDAFKSSKAYLEFDRGPYGSRTYSDEKGVVPMAYGASVADRNYCNRKKDPTCASFFFGDELLLHPELLKKIEEWFQNICNRVPSKVTIPWRYDRIVEVRQRSVLRLRQFMSCDAARKETRRVHLYIVRDFDGLFDRKHLDRNFDSRMEIERFIVREIVVKIN